MSLSEVVLLLEDVDLVAFYGQNDHNINALRKSYPDVTLTSRGGMIKINGDKKRVQEVKRKLELMLKTIQQFGRLSKGNFKDILSGENPFSSKVKTDTKNAIVYGRNGKPIMPRTKNQKKMVDLSEQNDILFAIGPAGQ